MNSAHRTLGPAVRPVYKVDERYCPELIGSCVLLQVAGRHFLASAAHVVGTSHCTLYIGGSPKLAELKGFKSSVHAPSLSRGRHHDDIDVVVFEMTDKMVADLGPVGYVGPASTNPNDAMEIGRPHVVMGYPWRKGRALKAIKVARAPLVKFVLTPSAIGYGAHALSDPLHLVLDFSHKRMRVGGQRAMAPNPEGMSGGAVCRCDADIRSGEVKSTLVAILVERKQLRRSVLVATRISVVTEMLRFQFPDVRTALPTSQRFHSHFSKS